MSAMQPAQAGALVRARLAHEPQDALEAAVVLEAWCGVRPPEALRLAAQLVNNVQPGTPAERQEVDDDSERWRLSEQIALLVALVALLAWSAPLIEAIGAAAFELTWKLAVPLTLLSQWGLRRRYLTGNEGLGRLRRAARPLLVGAALLPLLLAALLGAAGALGGLLVVLWVAAMIVGRRGWGVWYALLLAAVAVALWSGAPGMPMMLGAAAGGILLVAVALRGVPPTPSRPAHWRRALGAACLGGALGVMLIADGTVQWETPGALPALVLLPSVLGGLWGSAYLGALWTTLPLALRASSLHDRHHEGATRRAAAAIAGACLRLVATTLALSLVVALGPWARYADPTLLAWLLGGFGVVALATLLVTLHDAFGRPGWALGAVGCGLTAELVLRTAHPQAQAGAGLLVAGGVVVLLLLPPTLALIRQPARTIATVVNVR